MIGSLQNRIIRPTTVWQAFSLSHGRRSISRTTTAHLSTKTCWERGAIKVKDTDSTSNPYLDVIRRDHDPSLQLKTLEDELKGTIGRALGKQGDKIMYATSLMRHQLEKYETLLEKHQNPHHPDVVQTAETFNQHRKDAVQARWELMVHRQAAGLLVQNHNYVTKMYPIPEPLPVGTIEHTAQHTNNNEKQLINGQLDWWQQIGRWK